MPRVWIAHDIGRALNPTLVRGQVEGGVYMGLGEALMEEQAFRRLPREALARARAQVPVDPRIQEPDEPRHAGDLHGSRSSIPIRPGPFGAKEVGQGPLLPIMPAVANAVFDAVGVRIDEVPITPDKIVQGARGQGRGQAGARTDRRRFRTSRGPSR